jgi:hypothetical protein
MIGLVARLQAGARAIDINLLDIGKRELRGLEDSTEGGRRKSLVERTSRRASDIDPQGIEHAAITLVDIEPVVQELTEEPPGLRRARYVRALSVDWQVGSVTECGCGVTSHGESHAGDDWPRRAIGHTIVPTRFKSCIEA